MIDKLGGRKAILVALCLAIGTAVDLSTARGLSENLLTLLVGVLSLFVAGNGFEHFAKSRTPGAAATPPPDLSGLQADMAAMQEGLLAVGQGMADVGAIAKDAAEASRYVADYTKKVRAIMPVQGIDRP